LHPINALDVSGVLVVFHKERTYFLVCLVVLPQAGQAKPGRLVLPQARQLETELSFL